MHKRKQETREKFLKKLGLKKVPKDKEIDHKIPLIDGGTDTLRNLHLISKKNHKKKTAREARKRIK